MRFHTELKVDLKVLKENFDLLSERAPRNRAIFMVKASAYGHGLVPITQFSHQELGIEDFGVATLGEGIELRKKLPSMRSRILVFSDTGLRWEEMRRHYIDYNIVPVIGSEQELDFFLDDREFKNVPLVLNLNTGMNRLGLDWEKTEAIALKLKSRGRFRINHLITHFSSSFLPSREGDKTSRQYQSFLEAKQLFSINGIAIDETSSSNSGAIEQGIGLDESHIRPGLMLYGPASFEKGNWQGRNISSLHTYVVKADMIKRGTPVGYGGHVCHQDGWLVYLPLGYADGFLTYFSKMDIDVEGFRARILGRVNMDLSALLFPVEAAQTLESGQKIKLWNHDQTSVLKIAQNAQTIPYQIFTSLSERVPRTYWP